MKFLSLLECLMPKLIFFDEEPCQLSEANQCAIFGDGWKTAISQLASRHQTVLAPNEAGAVAGGDCFSIACCYEHAPCAVFLFLFLLLDQHAIGLSLLISCWL